MSKPDHQVLRFRGEIERAKLDGLSKPKALAETQTGELYPLPSWWKDVQYNANLDNYFDVRSGSHEYPSGLKMVRVDGVVVSVTDVGRGIMKAGESLPAEDFANLIVRGLIRGEGGMSPAGVKEPIDADTLVEVLKISYGPDGKIAPGLLELRMVGGVEKWVLAEKAFTNEAYGKDGGLFVSYEHIGVAKEAALAKIKAAETASLATVDTEGVVGVPPAEAESAAVIGVDSQPGLEATKVPLSPESGSATPWLCLVPGILLSAVFASYVLRIGRK